MKDYSHKYFSVADLEAISKAVKEAEKRTSGEIVPYFVPESDEYEEATWRAAMLFGAVPLTIFGAIRLFSDAWSPVGILTVVITFFASSIAGAFLVRYIPPLKRFFAGRDLLHHRASLRASQAFVSEEVFKTRDRTGILLFLSFFERTVVVLGDSGIHAKVQQHEWDRIVEIIVRGMKSGRPANGLTDAIRMCGELLQRRGVRRKKSDVDELPDTLRIRKK
ncbi:MAG: hypothetical protein WBD36_14990 [Bacteroidota bacterium]